MRGHHGLSPQNARASIAIDNVLGSELKPVCNSNLLFGHLGYFDVVMKGDGRAAHLGYLVPEGLESGICVDQSAFVLPYLG